MAAPGCVILSDGGGAGHFRPASRSFSSSSVILSAARQELATGSASRRMYVFRRMYSEKWFYVYIMTNRSMNFYIGVTNNIRERVFQHKTGAFAGSTSRYKLDRLVYWEKFKYVNSAIAREK